jgi:hypothetical protein
MKNLGTVAVGAGLTALLFSNIGCGERAEGWDAGVSFPLESFGLTGAVAIIDRPVHRVVTLTADDQQQLTRRVIPTGRNIMGAAALPDGSKLVVVSAGHRAQLGDPQADEAPSLTIVDGDASKDAVHFTLETLTAPPSGLALDPAGHWAVLYAAGTVGGAFVENPNELVIIDLSQPASATNPVVHTQQSFGGHPVRLTFSAALSLPAGTRHLLVVESDQDLSIVQLENPTMPEITVPLTSGTDARRLEPAGILIDDGDAARNDDVRIAVRMTNDRNLLTLQLVPAPTANGYRPTVNLTDVGGVPSDMAFVRTDGGLRLAALVPSTRSAVLLDLTTSLGQTVALPASYARLSLVTEAAGASATSDVALLWSAAGEGQGVAFWSLGQTEGQPYRSIETVGVAASVAGVFDVPRPHQSLKILKSASANSFYVLDLQTRTAAPFFTSLADLGVTVSATGERVWTYARNAGSIAVTDLATKHPRSLQVERPIAAVHELRRADGGHALVLLHAGGAVGATVFDAVTADDNTRRLFASLLIGGPYND